ncbi:MAG: hypothetical protein ACJASD_001450 [Sphingomonas echinoides]|jgi:hypothetical protein
MIIRNQNRSSQAVSPLLLRRWRCPLNQCPPPADGLYEKITTELQDIQTMLAQIFMVRQVKYYGLTRDEIYLPT